MATAQKQSWALIVLGGHVDTRRRGDGARARDVHPSERRLIGRWGADR
jgi:hypothetical protein